MRGTGKSTPEHEMRIMEFLLMKELHLSLSEINDMTSDRVGQYLTILDEMNIITKEKMDAINK